MVMDKTTMSVQELSAQMGISLPKAYAMQRVDKLDTIISKLYEDNVEGKISDERFMKMSASYEEEQNSLTERIAELKSSMDTNMEKSLNVEHFLKMVRKFTDIQELTAEIIREFIEKVYVHQTVKVDGQKMQKVKIIWNCIGEFTAPKGK